MGVVSAALAKLASVPVSGVTSYALDQLPDALIQAQLPALLILPELSGESTGLEPNAFTTGAGTFTVRVAHVLLLAPVAAGLGQRGVLPALIDAVDAYADALAADPTLDGTLPLPLRFTVQTGVTRYAGIDYHGATFIHTWTLHVS